MNNTVDKVSAIFYILHYSASMHDATGWYHGAADATVVIVFQPSRQCTACSSFVTSAFEQMSMQQAGGKWSTGGEILKY